MGLLLEKIYIKLKKIQEYEKFNEVPQIKSAEKHADHILRKYYSK